MDTAKKPARLAREEGRYEVARELSKARTLAGVDQHELAAACGVNRSVPHEWESREGGKSPWLVDAAIMPREVAEPLIRWLASKHNLAVSAADEARALDAATLHDVLREGGEAVSKLSAALADGELSPAELEEIERECDEAAAEYTRAANKARRLREEAVRDLKLVK